MTEPHADRRDRWLFIGGGLAVFLAVLVVVCRPWDLENAFMIGAPFGRDFANFWLGGHLAIAGNLDLLVDMSGYNELFSNTFHHNPEETFVYSYPPHSLLFVAPFGALPYLPAVFLWTLLNLVCIAGATRILRNDWRWAGAALVSPAVLTMVAFGHFGGVLALLATYVLLQAERRPAASGLCLALMSVKPQFALVIGLFLIFAGRWRALIWSVPATLALLAASVLAFGTAAWVNFLAWTIPLHARLIADFAIEGLRTVISVYAGARMAGLPGWAAQLAHYTFAIVVLWRAVVCFRRHGADARTITLALLAALAALPYFNSYDLAIVAPALTLALFEDRSGETPLLTFVPAILLWVAPVFALPFGLLALPIVPAVFAAVLLLALFGPTRGAGTGPAGVHQAVRMSVASGPAAP